MPKTYLPSDVLLYVQHAHSAGYKEGLDFAIHAMRIFDVERDSRVSLVLEYLSHQARAIVWDNVQLDIKLKEVKEREPSSLEQKLEQLARGWIARGAAAAKNGDDDRAREGISLVYCGEALLTHLGLELEP